MSRRSSTVALVLALALALMAGMLGCDSDRVSSSGGAAPAASPDDPRSLVEAMLYASEALKSSTSTCNADIQLNLDPSTMSEDELGVLAMFQGPIKASFSMAADYEAPAARLDMTLAVAGISYEMGVRLLGDDLWVSILGQWYDFAPVLEELDGDDVPAPELDLEQLEAQMDSLGVDPLDWLGEITLAGEETLDGVAVYRLSCIPDVQRMVRDGLVLLQDEEFMSSIDPSGELYEGIRQDLPELTDILEGRDIETRAMMDELDEMLTDFVVKLWIGKDDYMLRRSIVSLRIQVPPGEPSDGLESIDIKVEVDSTGFDQPVDVEPPPDYLPFSALEQIFGPDFPFPSFDEPTKS